MRNRYKPSKVEIIDFYRRLPTKSRQANAYETRRVSRHSRLVGFVLQWPSDFAGVKTRGKVGQIKIVCFDDERATLAAIKEGAIFGTVAQQPFEYGYQAVQMAARS